MTKRRSATYVKTLVYMDEPQLILLKAYKTNILAIAIPPIDGQVASFFATSVHTKDFDAYMDGQVDLRYMFTYGSTNLYTFDLMTMQNNKVSMDLWDGPPPPEYLPARTFFSRSHTEDDEIDAANQAEPETLYVDGEWDMPEFGEFYSRYSDIYHFTITTHAFTREDVTQSRKQLIKKLFSDKPFKGGFSYVHLYSDLPQQVSAGERLRMDKIRYESPGYVNVNGDKDTFIETRALISNFLQNRKELKKAYSNLHRFLSRRSFLKLGGRSFDNDDPVSAYIRGEALALASLMHMPEVETLRRLVEENALVFAKLVLSFFRRLDEASRYFAQGRVSFS
jgi:hypothetical protein